MLRNIYASVDFIVGMGCIDISNLDDTVVIKRN